MIFSDVGTKKTVRYKRVSVERGSLQFENLNLLWALGITEYRFSKCKVQGYLELRLFFSKTGVNSQQLLQ